MKKRLISLILAIAFCFCLVLPTSAASVTEAKVPELEVTTQAINPPASPNSAVRAGCGGYISGGYGVLTCTLGRHLSSAYVQAVVSSSSESGTVTCYVQLPNGAYQYLGTVPASGGSTPSVHMILASGTYTFVFEPTTTAQLYVSGSISE